MPSKRRTAKQIAASRRNLAVARSKRRRVTTGILAVGVGAATIYGGTKVTHTALYGTKAQKNAFKVKLRSEGGLANLNKREVRYLNKVQKPVNISSRKNMRKWNKLQKKRYAQHMKTASPIVKETIYRRQHKMKSMVGARMGTDDGVYRRPYSGPRPSGYKLVKGSGLKQNYQRRPNRSHLRIVY